MTAVERAELEQRMRDTKESRARNWQLMISPWMTGFLLWYLLWAAAAWSCRKLFDIDFGIHGRWATIIASTIVGAWSFWLFLDMRRQSRHLNSRLESLGADIATGEVEERTLQLTEARRYQEPEHDGLIYFLRTRDDGVFVLFDYDSQALGVQGQNALDSTLEPAERLAVIRAVKSHDVTRTRFEGRPLELGAPIPFELPPRHWPESETFLGVDWPGLDAWMTRRAGRSRKRK